MRTTTLQDPSWSIVGYAVMCFGIGLLLCCFVVGCTCPTNLNADNEGALIKTEKKK